MSRFNRSQHENNQMPDLNKSSASSNGNSRKNVYVLAAGIITIVIIAVAIFAFIPQGAGDSIPLGLSYSIGEKMVYNTTNTVTNQMNDSSIDVAINPASATYNSSSTYEVIGFDGETYTLNVTLQTIQSGDFSFPAITTKVNKADYYRDFLPSGAPPFFNNVSGNPTLSATFGNSQVSVGDVWNLPVSTGNSSLGLTGELSLKFAEIEEITVPAGTYKVFRIEVSSNTINLHADPDYLDAIHLALPKNMSLQISGSTYLEQGTCRLVRSELTQVGQQSGSSSKSIIITEKTLVEHAKP